MSATTYATLSNHLVVAATVIYALACMAHLAQWAMSRHVGAPVEQKVLVGVGAGVGAGSSAPAEQLVERVDGPSDADSAAIDRSDAAGRVGVALTMLALLVLVAGDVFRALAANRVPWGNMYEFACTGIALATVVYLVLVVMSHVQWLGSIFTAFAVVVLGMAGLFVYVPAGPLVPALDSYWLWLHVTAAAIAGGSFCVGAGASVLYLVKSRAERTTPADKRTGYLWRLPSSADMDRVAYRVHAFAFPVWTFAALIAGPIWAQYAWGKYWGWDPKEVWAFITWVVYAGYLHARATAGWRGRGAAIIALVGFATFLFNFIGINLFVSGLHSYAGV
ncbi:MAG: c-type cytochrome biogenesis protein CcsB [Nocardioidaceae bacterium]